MSHNIPGDIKMEKNMSIKHCLPYFVLISSQNQAVQMHRNYLVSCWCCFPPWGQIYWALRAEISNQLQFSWCGVMDFLNTFHKNKLRLFNLPEQVDGRGGQLPFGTFRFPKQTAVAGTCFCTKPNDGSAVIGMVLWHSFYIFLTFFLNFPLRFAELVAVGPFLLPLPTSDLC